MVKRRPQAKEQIKLTHFFRHPKYYKQLKNVREDEEKKRATSGKQQATSQDEPQAAGAKTYQQKEQRTNTPETQATSDKPHEPESASVEDS